MSSSQIGASAVITAKGIELLCVAMSFVAGAVFAITAHLTERTLGRMAALWPQTNGEAENQTGFMNVMQKSDEFGFLPQLLGRD